MASSAVKSKFNAKHIQQGAGPIAKFFLTDIGRTTVRSVGLFSAFGVCTAYISIHSFVMHRYRNVVRYYNYGLPTTVEGNLLQQAKSVVDDFKFTYKYVDGFQFFHMNSLNPFTIGSLKLKYGAYIGLPKIFDYENATDVELREITVDNKPVLWGSDDGQLLKESLVLSPNAKKFAIAQQIALADTQYVYIKGLLASAGVLSYTILSIHGNNVFLGFQRTRSFRFAIYSVVAFITSGLFVMSLDFYQRHLEKYMDNQAMSLGLDYALGAVEYFTQVAKRNIALRGLMAKGESEYTQDGEINSWIRSKHIPIRIRKERAEHQVQKYLSQSSSSSSNNNNNNTSTTKDDNKVSVKDNNTKTISTHNIKPEETSTNTEYMYNK